MQRKTSRPRSHGAARVITTLALQGLQAESLAQRQSSVQFASACDDKDSDPGCGVASLPAAMAAT